MTNDIYEGRLKKKMMKDEIREETAIVGIYKFMWRGDREEEEYDSGRI